MISDTIKQVAFKNFSIWRGKLPHWRADGVDYYATFRHRRELEESERDELLRGLLHWNGRRLDIQVLFVLPEATHMIFRVIEVGEKLFDFSDLLEKAKTKAGKKIILRSGERWAPFYTESYDHILRDAEDLEEHWSRILAEAENAGLDDLDEGSVWVSPEFVR